MTDLTIGINNPTEFLKKYDINISDANSESLNGACSYINSELNYKWLLPDKAEIHPDKKVVLSWQGNGVYLDVVFDDETNFRGFVINKSGRPIPYLPTQNYQSAVLISLEEVKFYIALTRFKSTMPVIEKEKWLYALSSGRYHKGKHEYFYQFENEDDSFIECFCCLGVLADINKIEKNVLSRNPDLVGNEILPKLGLNDAAQEALAILNDGSDGYPINFIQYWV